ncbi:MAG: DKNYY domain-containing protein [Flavobacteriaceae bacterium]|nr:DKNYY domain-containing protein [Flavobacteriaceae bacterium]
MENTKKIIEKTLLIYVFLIGFIGCTQENYNIKNPEILYVDKKTGNLIFKPYYSKQITEVIDGNKIKKLKEVLDERTFDLLYNFREDSLKINNIYYNYNPVAVYYRDKNFIYFLVDSVLIKKGNINEYEVLGGLYLKLNNKIFWNAIEIKNVDIKTFHTINVMREKSEWSKTVGIDKNHIYNSNLIMDESVFDKLYWSNVDSLRKQYFP